MVRLVLELSTNTGVPGSLVNIRHAVPVTIWLQLIRITQVVTTAVAKGVAKGIVKWVVKTHIH